MLNSWLWLWLLAILLFFVCIYKHITRNFNHWKNLNVPYLQPAIFFGNIYPVICLNQSLGQLAKDVYNYTNSNFTGFFLFDQPFLLIRDPDVIKHVLIKNFDHFDSRTVFNNQREDDIGSKVMFVLKNPEWKNIRTKFTNVFTAYKIKCMLPLITEVSTDLTVFIDNEIRFKDGEIECRDMAIKYTAEVIASCAFGFNYRCLNEGDATFHTQARKIVDIQDIRIAMRIGAHFFAPFLAKLCRMKLFSGDSVEYLRSVFFQHMAQRKSSNIKRQDVIDVLIQMKEVENNTLDDNILLAQAIQFLVAGFETTGSTISFALYELALNPDIQSRLREEIKGVLEKHGELSSDALQELNYLDNVVNETLRMYPALTYLDRRCNKAYTIPNTDVTIPKGMAVYISLLGLHMDPKHFPNPEKFDPDRFSEENKALIKPFTFMPFGEGPRNCIGERFGLISAKSALATIICNYEVEPNSKTPIPIVIDPRSGFLILPKDGIIPLTFKKHS